MHVPIPELWYIAKKLLSFSRSLFLFVSFSLSLSLSLSLPLGTRVGDLVHVPVVEDLGQVEAKFNNLAAGAPWCSSKLLFVFHTRLPNSAFLARKLKKKSCDIIFEPWGTYYSTCMFY